MSKECKNVVCLLVHYICTMLHQATGLLLPFLWLCQMFIFLIFYFPLNNRLTPHADTRYVKSVQWFQFVTWVVQVVTKCCFILVLWRPCLLHVSSLCTHVKTNRITIFLKIYTYYFFTSVAILYKTTTAYETVMTGVGEIRK